MRIKALIIRAEGTNCDLETFEALKIAGAKPEIVHINRILRTKRILEDYQLIVIPGGFSYGDCISAGKILANMIKHSYLMQELKSFVDEGKPLLGICNGFQVLLKLGLLPFSNEMRQLATLTTNAGGLFIDKWVYLKFNEKTNCIFAKNSLNVIYLPINHAEGRFIAKKDVLDKIVENNQIVYQYSSQSGDISEKFNPNGSYLNIAAICNENGNVMGIMPHPEKFINKYMHPTWTKYPNIKEEGDGLFIFKNAVDYAKKF